MFFSAPSDSFEYICYGLTVIINSLILLKRGSTLDVRISFFVIFNTRKLEQKHPLSAHVNGVVVLELKRGR